MPLSARLTHARMTPSTIARQSLASSRISVPSPVHSSRAFVSSPLRPTVVHPRLCGRSSALQYYSIWERAKERAHTYRHHVDNRKTPGLRHLSGTNVSVSGDFHQQLMENFLARVDEVDPAPARYSLRWWLRILYEAQPTRCITLVVQDEASREAAREALQKVCERWDGWVGALRNSYVCLVVVKDTIDALRKDLEHNRDLSFMPEARIYCDVDSRNEADAISASSGLKSYFDASKNDEGEAQRLHLHSKAHLGQITSVNHSERAAASSCISNFVLRIVTLDQVVERFPCLVLLVVGTVLTYFITSAMSGHDEQQSGSNREQEQHHGESHNRGKSQQMSALGVRYCHIRAGGDVYITTHIHHGCNANPLSSSSPTVGNKQLSGNKDLSEEQ